MYQPAAGHPTPEEIIAFVDGDTTQEVAGHVHGCATCSTEVDAFAGTQTDLRQLLYRFDCPQPHALGEYELGLVSTEERVRVAQHAVECDACTAELLMLREYMATETALPQSIFSQLRRVVATVLVPASGLGLAGVRGADSALRQYRVEGASVSIGNGPDRGSLIGLLVLEDAERMRGEVRLLPAQGLPLVADLDDLGNFDFFDVAPGAYALEIQLPDEIIVVQHLQVD